MAAIDFPNNPTIGQIYTTNFGYAFEWDGTVWKNYYAPGVYGGQFRLSTDPRPELGGHLESGGLNINQVGILTASYFYGDGSNITNVSAALEVTEITSSGTKSNTQGTATEIQFLNTDFNVTALSNGRVLIESAGGSAITSLNGISAASYPSITFSGTGIDITNSGSQIQFSASLEGLSDTQNIDQAANGQVLKYSSGLGKWIPQADATDAAGGEVGPNDYVEAAGFQYSAGNWSPTTNGAVTTLTGTSQLSAWIDGLNDILGLLAPPAPPTIDGIRLNISSGTTSISGTYKLCSGFSPSVNFTGTSFNATAGGAYKVVKSNESKAILCEDIEYRGPGNSGTLTAYINNDSIGSVTFTDSTQSGYFGNNTIQISYNMDAADWYNDATSSTRSVNGRAISPGFYDIYNADLRFGNNSTYTIPTGFNIVRAEHVDGSSTFETDYYYQNQMVFYYTTNNLSAPTISFGTVNPPTGFTPRLSSGVSHVPSGVAFSYTINLTNLTGDIYNYSGGPVTISAGDVTTNDYIYYSDIGSTTPVQNLGVSSPVSYVYSADVRAEQFLQAQPADIFGTHTVTSPWGTATGKPSYSDTVLLYSSLGTPSGNPPVESGGSISGVGGSLQRVSSGNGADTPTMTSTGGAWSSANPLATFEASIVGGVLGHDLNDYTTGYFPVSSVNYSGNDASQFCQFSFVATTIQGFTMNITGSYSGLWVAQPNNAGGGAGGWMTGTEPGWNGWANCFVPFAAGRPGSGTLGGSTTANPATGSSGTVGVNFGTSSTANSTGSQLVYIRFKFTAGQQITSLSISS